MEAIRRLCGFAAGLERLLAAHDAAELEATWDELNLGQLGWEALALARRANTEAFEPALAEVDRRLLAALERCRAFLDPHIVTFRVPELERWQHAAAAALVGARWGVAGLRTVIADTQAPLGRRYFAFLALAERHPKEAWPLFAKYLQTPGAHHAFVAASVEAARYYPGQAADGVTRCCVASSRREFSNLSTCSATGRPCRCLRNCSWPAIPTPMRAAAR